MWTALSDDFYDNPKIDAAGDAGAGAFAKALSYCGRHGTDGLVSAAAARKLASPEALDAVTQAGLWQPVTAGDTFTVTGRHDTGGRPRTDVELVAQVDGYMIVDYLQHNPTSAEYDGKVAQARAAGAKGGKRKHENARLAD